MTGESLKRVMGNSESVEWNQLWVEPLQKAMDEFNINTPQRIAAFLSEVRHETAGLTKLIEDAGLYRVKKLLEFVSGFTPGKTQQDNLRNPYKEGDNIDGHILTKRQAIFLNLKAFVKNDLGLDDLDGVSMPEDTAIFTATGQSAEELKVGGDGRWTREIGYKFFDRVYSEDVGNGNLENLASGIPGDGLEADSVAHNWLGRGLIHMTHKDPYAKFATYIEQNYPELVTQIGGKTIAQTLLDNTRLIIDIENNPNSRMLAALSGAWFWGVYKGSSLNTQADQLNFDDYANQPVEQPKFNAISQRINGNDKLDDRFDKYQKVASGILSSGNPYEEMKNALSKLGIIASGAEGYATKFGISLSKRMLAKIEDNHHLMADKLVLNCINSQLYFATENL